MFSRGIEILRLDKLCEINWRDETGGVSTGVANISGWLLMCENVSTASAKCQSFHRDAQREAINSARSRTMKKNTDFGKSRSYANVATKKGEIYIRSGVARRPHTGDKRQE